MYPLWWWGWWGNGCTRWPNHKLSGSRMRCPVRVWDRRISADGKIRSLDYCCSGWPSCSRPLDNRLLVRRYYWLWALRPPWEHPWGVAFWPLQAYWSCCERRLKKDRKIPATHWPDRRRLAVSASRTWMIGPCSYQFARLSFTIRASTLSDDMMTKFQFQ